MGSSSAEVVLSSGLETATGWQQGQWNCIAVCLATEGPGRDPGGEVHTLNVEGKYMDLYLLPELYVLIFKCKTSRYELTLMDTKL